MTERPPGAELALLLDVGSAWAKAGVIGRSRGRWRLVAHAAQPVAWGSNELRRALVDQLETAADPRLGGRFDDLLDAANRIECHSPRRQGRLAIVAVSRELSGSSARRAAEAAGWQAGPVITLDDGRSLADRLRLLQAAEVDAWLAVGGFDEGTSQRALECAALVAAARRPGSGPVVWAGSRRLATEVVSLFEDGASSSVANPRPDARHDVPAPLRDHLDGLLRTIVTDADAAHLAPVTFPRAVAALARESHLRILAVDVGARSAIRVLADADGSPSVRVSASGGLSAIAQVPGAAGRIVRAAADAGDEASVADLLQTLRARPSSLPQTTEEVAAMQAAARIALASLVEDGPPDAIDLLVGAGRTIAAAPRPADAMRMLVDGVRPIGVTQVAVDPAAVLGPLGSLEGDEVREGVRLLADDLLLPLGTAVVTRGGEAGGLAMRVSVHRPGWPTPAPITLRVGQLQVVPLARGAEAELSIELGSGVSLGAPRRAPRIRAMATGGAVGLVLDARGIPIGLPRRGDDRRAVQASWAETIAREERIA
jgi:hypothetical protein